MNISIKHILFSLSIALLLTSKSFSQKADFAISSVNNVTTASYSVTVKANSFDKVMGWQGSIIWDNSKSIFAGITNLSSALSGIQFNNTVAGNTGRLSFLWIDSLLKAKTLPDSTALFDINFSTIANASGVMNIAFSNIPTYLQVSDSLGKNIVNVAYTNGVVSFANTNVPPSFAIQSIKNFSGTSFQTNITVNNFRQVLGIQGTVIWDSTLFSLSNVSNINAKINSIGFNSTSKGRLLYLWLDSALTAQTLNDSSVLFTLNFNVVNQSFTKSDIKFSSSYVPLQCIDANTNNIAGTSYTNGLISKAGAVISPTFYLKNISNPQGLQILQMPVSAKNFTDIASFQGSINWSSAKYQFSSISNIHSKLSNISFNNTVVADTAYLNYLWYDANATLQTIPDDSVLFIINFITACNVIGFDNVQFSNKPTQLLVTNLDSALIGVSYANGWINSPSSLTPDITIQANSNIICTNSSISVFSVVSNGGPAPAFIWKKNNVTISGANQSQINFTSLNNLDSVVCVMISNANCRTKDSAFSNKIIFKVQPAAKDTIVLSSCIGVVYKGTTYTSSISLKDTIKTASNCDSIYRTVNIIIQAAVPTNSSISVNGCDSVAYNSKFYYSSTILKDTLRTIDKCDSVYVSVTITVSPGFKGNIIHPTKGYIKKVNAFLNTSNSLVDSSYKFSCLTSGSNGVVKLSKNNDVNKANGVTSVDVLLVQRHILNTAKLNSAYKIIAADVDGNKSVNSVDVLRMKRLILGTDTTYVSALRGNRLWEFIDSSYQFPDTTNPFPFKDSISFSNLNSSKNNQTFIGVKLGDVNYDLNIASLKSLNNKPFQINYSVIDSLGFAVVKFSSNEIANLSAIQCAIRFDAEKYEFLNISDNKLNLDFNINQANINGNITMLWVEKNGEVKRFNSGEKLFELVFKNKLPSYSNQLSSFEIELNNSLLESECWVDVEQKVNFLLKKNKSACCLFKNENWSIYPTVNDGKFNINVDMAQSEIIHLSVYNDKGQNLYSNQYFVSKGRNTININLNDKLQLSSGLYYMLIDNTNQFESKKIIIKQFK